MVFGLRFRRVFRDFKVFKDFKDFRDFRDFKNFSDLRVGEGEWEFGVLWPFGRGDWSVEGVKAVK